MVNGGFQRENNILNITQFLLWQAINLEIKKINNTIGIADYFSNAALFVFPEL